jgi:hypothetical protein
VAVSDVTGTAEEPPGGVPSWESDDVMLVAAGLVVVVEGLVSLELLSPLK